MITRGDVLSRAVDECMKDIYSFVRPSVDWEEFVKENKLYSDRYRVWERFNHLYHKENKTKKELEEYSTYPVAKWEGKSITECIGPRPYEFYYIPKEVMNDIIESYVSAYRMDQHQELLDTISILKRYCEEPIVDKYIDDYTDEYGNHHPGYRGYDHPDNLIEEVRKILIKYDDHMDSEISEEVVNKFFEFLDMAGKFYDWNSYLNSFNTSIYFGCSPNSSKESVIKNWKKYRKQDIEINEEEIKNEYYGEED